MSRIKRAKEFVISRMKEDFAEPGTDMSDAEILSAANTLADFADAECRDLEAKLAVIIKALLRSNRRYINGHIDYCTGDQCPSYLDLKDAQDVAARWLEENGYVD